MMPTYDARISFRGAPLISRELQCPTDERSPVEIRAVTPDELCTAAAILAQSMRGNPLHVRVFGVDLNGQKRYLSRFLGLLVAYVHSNGEVLGAYVQGELIGVLGMIQPGRCRPTLSGRLHFGFALLTSVPPTVLLRIHRWLAAWERNDPREPHWHIGPLAVLPAYRRHGIGRRLMMHCCQRMDALSAAAWLETDLEINVTFYRTLGFVVVKQELVLGVPSWFMSRSPMCNIAAGAPAPSRA